MPTGSPMRPNVPSSSLRRMTRVECAAAEVVDRQRLPDLERPRRLVVARGGLGFGDQLDVGDADPGECGADQFDPMPAPRRRVGQGDRFGALPLPLRDQLHDVGDGLRVQLLRGQRATADHERNLVADAPLELADQPLGLRDAATFGGIAEGQLTVVRDERDRGDAVALPAQREGRGDDTAVRCDSRRCCGYPARPHIHGQKK